MKTVIGPPNPTDEELEWLERALDSGETMNGYYTFDAATQTTGDTMNEWHTIDTAPEDTALLVTDGNDVSVAIKADLTKEWLGVVDGDVAREFIKGYLEPIQLFPTHWMPLPDPPKAL